MQTAVTPSEFRSLVRSRDYTGYTANLCKGYVQANLCILPRAYAYDFLLYCNRNRAACPVLAVSEVGSPRLPALGANIDVRTDLPRYQVFRQGVLCDTVEDVTELWQDDFVVFALGCSFSFEEALQDAGLPLSYLDRQEVAGVYESSLDTEPAGLFGGKLIVTMRPFTPSDALRATQITSRFPNVHGAPVHIGDPAMIGVDLDRRYQNIGSSQVADDQIPVFWACGLTPQSAIARAKLPLVITHAPSSMLVTDLLNSSLAVF